MYVTCVRVFRMYVVCVVLCTCCVYVFCICGLFPCVDSARCLCVVCKCLILCLGSVLCMSSFMCVVYVLFI